MKPITRGYLIMAARRYGVPSMFEDDAAQECELELWKAQPESRGLANVIIRNTTVSFVRTLKGRKQRFRTISLEEYQERHPDFDVREEVDMPVESRVPLYLAAWRRLTHRERQIMLRSVANPSQPDVSFQRVYQVRTKLRRLVA